MSENQETLERFYEHTERLASRILEVGEAVDALSTKIAELRGEFLLMLVRTPVSAVEFVATPSD